MRKAKCTAFDGKLGKPCERVFWTRGKPGLAFCRKHRPRKVAQQRLRVWREGLFKKFKKGGKGKRKDSK